MTTAIQFLRSNVPGLRPNPSDIVRRDADDQLPDLNDPGLYFKSN